MTDPLMIFIAGFVLCSILIALYLLYRLIDILAKFVSILQNEFNDE